MSTPRPSLERVVDEVLEKVSIANLIGRDQPLHRKGTELWGLCPFHAEKTPSFKVDEQRRFYHCFGCGAHGNALDYVIHRQNLPFKDALRWLAEQVGVVLPEFSRLSPKEDQTRKDLYALHGLAMDYAHDLLKKSPKAQKARDYLASRGISSELVERFHLGYCDGSLVCYLRQFYASGLIEEAGLGVADSTTSKDRFVNRILFPIFDLQKRVIAFGGRLVPGEWNHDAPKYLNSKETPLFHKGEQLFNLYAALENAKQKPLILVEGYMDVLTMTAYGFPQTVAALGTALTETQMNLLWRYSSQPVLCFDGDIAGKKASVRALERALPHLKPEKTLFFCYLPEGKDPDDLLRSEGAEALQKRLDAATPLIDVLWEHLKEPYELKNAGRAQWIPEDWAALKRDVSEALAKITNGDVREFYKRQLNTLFFQQQRTTRSWEALPSRRKVQVSAPRSETKVMGQKILLGILLKNPILLLEVGEFVERLDFADPILREIQGWLLDRFYLGEDGEDEASVEQREQFLEQLNVRTLQTHAPFLFDSSKTSEEILARWREIWLRTVETDDLQGDLKEAFHQLKENFNEAAWQRVKALVSGVAQLKQGAKDGPPGGDPEAG